MAGRMRQLTRCAFTHTTSFSYLQSTSEISPTHPRTSLSFQTASGSDPRRREASPGRETRARARLPDTPSLCDTITTRLKRRNDTSPTRGSVVESIQRRSAPTVRRRLRATRAGRLGRRTVSDTWNEGYASHETHRSSIAGPRARTGRACTPPPPPPPPILTI